MGCGEPYEIEVTEEMIEAGIDALASSEFAKHETVNHSRGEYARDDVTTNTVEGFFPSAGWWVSISIEESNISSVTWMNLRSDGTIDLVLVSLMPNVLLSRSRAQKANARHGGGLTKPETPRQRARASLAWKRRNGLV